jgi:dTDP-4-dehydrorhamnose reductase
MKPITTEQLARPANRPAYSVLSKAKYTGVTGHVMRTWEAALNEYMTLIRKD